MRTNRLFTNTLILAVLICAALLPSAIRSAATRDEPLSRPAPADSYPASIALNEVTPTAIPGAEVELRNTAAFVANLYLPLIARSETGSAAAAATAQGVTCPELGSFIPPLTLCAAVQPSPDNIYWNEHPNKMQFSDCQDYSAWEKSNYLGDFTFSGSGFDSPQIPKPTLIPPDRYVFQIIFHAKGGRATMVRPEWNNINNFEQRQVENQQLALVAHERGHGNIHGWVAARLSGAFEVKANSEAEARKSVRPLVTNELQKAQTLSREFNLLYDQITDHGRTQEQVGGTNIQFIHCEPNLAITPAQLGEATVNQPYNQLLHLTSLELDYIVSQPVAWNIVEGFLPPGLTLDNMGMLSGNPTQEGEFLLRISAVDSQGYSAEMTYALVVVADSTPTPTPTPLPTPTPAPPDIISREEQMGVMVRHDWTEYINGLSVIWSVDRYSYLKLKSISDDFRPPDLPMGTSNSWSYSNLVSPNGNQRWEEPNTQVDIPLHIIGEVSETRDTRTFPFAGMDAANWARSSIASRIIPDDRGFIIEGNLASALTLGTWGTAWLNGQAWTKFEVQFYIPVTGATYEATWDCNLGGIILFRDDMAWGERFINEGVVVGYNYKVQSCEGSTGLLLNGGRATPYTFIVANSLSMVQSETREGSFRLVVRYR